MSNERPLYRVLAVYGFFADDDNLYPEGATLYWDGEPNEEMEPMNEAARQRMIAYLEKLDDLGRKAAEKNGRAYAGRPRNIDGALLLARQDEEFKLRVRGVEKDKVSVELADAPKIPEVGNANPKRGRGRPSYKNVEIISN